MMASPKTLAKSMAYELLDLCTAGRGVRRVICGEPIRFPARWCRWYPAVYEPATFAFLRRHCAPGDTVFDLGAHFGLFTVVMARQVGPAGRVFSFEPTPLTREVLDEIVRLNRCDEIVEVRPEAVAGTTGTATFFDTGDVASNANSLLQTARSRSGLKVPTVDLDSFVAARSLRPSFLKVDVEGVELDFLRGAQQTFQEYRPAVALSLHPASFRDRADTLATIWSLLMEYRMSVRLLEDYHFASGGETPLSRDWFCTREEVFDVGLLPLEADIR